MDVLRIKLQVKNLPDVKLQLLLPVTHRTHLSSSIQPLGLENTKDQEFSVPGPGLMEEIHQSNL